MLWLNSDAEAIRYMQNIYAEIEKRNRVLLENNVDTWSSMTTNRNPRQLIVVDEFSNLSDGLANRDRDELWRWARMSTQEGGKTGIHIAIALQDPTADNIDLRIRRNCLPVSFRVRDSFSSRAVLAAGGAELLPPRQFITRLNGLQRGVSITATDDDIAAFIAARPVAPAAPPTWIDAEPVADAAEEIADTDPVASLAQQIRPAWASGERSKSGLARSIGKAYAGTSFTKRLSDAIEMLEREASTPTPTA